MTTSVSSRSNCYDNARADLFSSTLKIERIYRHSFGNPALASQGTLE